MKISIIGAGNVGSVTAMRLAQENMGEILLVDIAKGLAQGKAFDLEDARYILKYHYDINGSKDISKIQGSDIVVITAGLTRKPGMTREDLLAKNALILKEVCAAIKKSAADSIVIVVTNPLDVLTYVALKTTGFKAQKVLGMGASLDAARFANLISKELHIPITDIEACVVGSHGEGMLPIARLTKIKGVSLDEFADENKVEELLRKTTLRGAEIISLLGSASAYFAPSAAIAEIVRAIAADQKKIVGVSAYLNGEYGAKDVCIGVPCRLGKNGIEKIIDLGLNLSEKESFHRSAESIRRNIEQLAAHGL